MTWTALIPLKGSTNRKSRLAPRLSPEQRWRLAENMFDHVAGVLRTVPAIRRMIVLSGMPPSGWREAWVADLGRGLNDELDAVRATLGDAKLLIINADLPFLQVAEVIDFLARAEAGCAIAPDRHGTGTNAVALSGSCSFQSSFGPESFQRHTAAKQDVWSVVEHSGLAFDIDTPEDYELALAAGMKPADRNMT